MLCKKGADILFTCLPEEQKNAQETVRVIEVLGAAAQPVEQAAVFVFLASDDASYVTGEIYGATGGRMPL